MIWAERVIVACARCQKPFERMASEAKRAKVHFCSRDCYKPPVDGRSCKKCGKTYKPKKWNSGFCSDKCFREEQSANRKQGRCRVCGKATKRTKRADGDGYAYALTCGAKECRKKPGNAINRLISEVGVVWAASASLALSRLNQQASRERRYGRDPWLRKCEAIVGSFKGRHVNGTGRVAKPPVDNWHEAVGIAIRRIDQRAKRSQQTKWERKAETMCRNWRRKEVWYG